MDNILSIIGSILTITSASDLWSDGPIHEIGHMAEIIIM